MQIGVAAMNCQVSTPAMDSHSSQSRHPCWTVLRNLFTERDFFFFILYRIFFHFLAFSFDYCNL